MKKHLAKSVSPLSKTWLLLLLAISVGFNGQLAASADSVTYSEVGQLQLFSSTTISAGSSQNPANPLSLHFDVNEYDISEVDLDASSNGGGSVQSANLDELFFSPVLPDGQLVGGSFAKPKFFLLYHALKLDC